MDKHFPLLRLRTPPLPYLLVGIVVATSPCGAQDAFRTLSASVPGVPAERGTLARISQELVRDVTLINLRAADSLLAIVLPKGTIVRVEVVRCGRANYSYTPATRTVRLCTEMNGYARAVVKAALSPERVRRMEEVARDDEAEDAIDAFLLFGTLHEIGHAVMHQFNTPVLGNREDAADGFAAFVLIEGGEFLTGLAAAQWFAWRESLLIASNTDIPRDYSDSHPFPGQRDARLRCLLAGRLGMRDNPGERTHSANCIAEWTRLSTTWRTMLRRRVP